MLVFLGPVMPSCPALLGAEVARLFRGASVKYRVSSSSKNCQVDLSYHFLKPSMVHLKMELDCELYGSPCGLGCRWTFFLYFCWRICLGEIDREME